MRNRLARLLMQQDYDLTLSEACKLAERLIARGITADNFWNK
jgi:hypothetical protein